MKNIASCLKMFTFYSHYWLVGKLDYTNDSHLDNSTFTLCTVLQRSSLSRFASAGTGLTISDSFQFVQWVLQCVLGAILNFLVKDTEDQP